MPLVKRADEAAADAAADTVTQAAEPPPPDNQPAPTEDDEGGSLLSAIPFLPPWVLVIGAVILLLIILCCCYCCYCRKGCCKGKTKKMDAKTMNRYLLDYEDGEMEMETSKKKKGKDKDEKAEKKPGKLHYAIDYDFKEEKLSIRVINAFDLPAMDVMGSSDPYVKVYILPDRIKFKTKIHKKSLNPVFNEVFTEEMKYADMRQKTVLFDVFDWDRFSRDDRIGQVQLNLDVIDFSKTHEGWKDLSSGDHGEVCFSLRYVPTTGKLTVIILEASNLRRMDTRGLSDPYVKMCLYEEGKRYAKKKTTIKDCTLNPYYNESFTFKVSYERIKKSTLAVTVVDYDRVGSSEPIGQVILGDKVIGSGQAHWRDVIDKPGQGIARRHLLR